MSRPGQTGHGAALLVALAAAAAPARGEPGLPLRAVAPEDLRVEAGGVAPLEDGAFAVRDPGLRAVVPGSSGEGAEVAFVYRGPTSRLAPLASGEPRRQVGLKLRAGDTCNVLYVMWHLEPGAGVQVQLKRNPGQDTHAACRDGGYQLQRPRFSRPAPPVLPGTPHRLSAALAGLALRVEADGLLVWEGELAEAAGELRGPAGLRTDNGEFDVRLRVVQATDGRRTGASR